MALHEYLVEEVALDCAEGLLTRREALRRLGLLGLTASAAAAVLAACGSDKRASPTTSTTATSTTPASGAPSSGASTSAATSTAGNATASSVASPTLGASSSTTAPAPSAGTAEEIRFPGPNGELIGALSIAPSARGAVLVIHENRGLTPHIRSIPPRLARDGYTALAIDLLSEEGGTASLPSEGDATAALGRAPAARLLADLRAGLDELVRRAPNAKLAVIGFCFGGGMTWQLLAAGEPRLAAAVPFYGPAPASADFSGSRDAAVLAIYAGNDARVNATRDSASKALDAAGLTHDTLTIDGVDHAFFNDTGARYNADAAGRAYAAMLAWFAKHLAG